MSEENNNSSTNGTCIAKYNVILAGKIVLANDKFPVTVCEMKNSDKSW